MKINGMLGNDLAFLNASKKSTKEAIITILSEEWPLSAKDIYLRLTKGVKTVSYQAVHKTLNELEEAKVINKKGREYELSLAWVDSSINNFNKIKQTYSKKIGRITINKDTAQPQVFKFTNYSDMCVNMAELLASKVLSNKSDLSCVCTLEHGWFPLRFNFTDYLLLAKMVQRNPGAINIIRKKTPYGKWIHRQYQKINSRCAPIGTPVDVDEDLFVQGDYIIEVRFSEETKKMFDKYYNKCHNIEDIFKEFGLQNEPEVDITVTITKNQQLAKFLKNKLEEIYFQSVAKEAKEKGKKAVKAP